MPVDSPAERMFGRHCQTEHADLKPILQNRYSGLFEPLSVCEAEWPVPRNSSSNSACPLGKGCRLLLVRFDYIMIGPHLRARPKGHWGCFADPCQRGAASGGSCHSGSNRARARAMGKAVPIAAYDKLQRLGLWGCGGHSVITLVPRSEHGATRSTNFQ